MTYILEIKKDYARQLLEVLQQQDAIALQLTEAVAPLSSQPGHKRTFDALSLDTRGFKFDRDEANER